MAEVNFAVTLPIIPAAAPVKVTTASGKPYAGLNAKGLSGGAAVIYGVNRQAERADNTAKFGKVIADGATTVWTAADIPALANADLQAAAGLNATNTLRVVVEVDGVPFLREGSDETPTAGEFKVADNGGTELTIGETLSAGSVIKVHIADAADITANSALTADVISTIVVQDFMGTATAVASLSN